MDDLQKDKVGTTAAGAETYKPLIEDAVAKLLGRQSVVPASAPQVVTAKKVCFVGLENKSAEELGDFKDHICQIIDEKIIQSGVFEPISGRYVEEGLRATRLRPGQLMIPSNQRAFLAVMEQSGQPFDYLLFATLSSGTTHGNGGNMQRNYRLDLELVNINNGRPDKESATIRKAYRR